MRTRHHLVTRASAALRVSTVTASTHQKTNHDRQNVSHGAVYIKPLSRRLTESTLSRYCVFMQTKTVYPHAPFELASLYGNHATTAVSAHDVTVDIFQIQPQSIAAGESQTVDAVAVGRLILPRGIAAEVAVLVLRSVAPEQLTKAADGFAVGPYQDGLSAGIAEGARRERALLSPSLIAARAQLSAALSKYLTSDDVVDTMKHLDAIVVRLTGEP